MTKMHIRKHGGEYDTACGAPYLHSRCTMTPSRVTCRSCLRILRNIGQLADGRLRAAAAGEGGGR